MSESLRGKIQSIRDKKMQEWKRERDLLDKRMYENLKAYVGDLNNWTKSDYSFSIEIDVNIYGDHEDLYRRVASDLDIDVEVRERFDEGVYYVRYSA